MVTIHADPYVIHAGSKNKSMIGKEWKPRENMSMAVPVISAEDTQRHKQNKTNKKVI